MLNLSTPTPFGRAVIVDGWLHVTASPDEAAAWSRALPSWPCSVLASCTGDVAAEFAPNGDLVDLEHPGAEDVPAPELTAWVAAVLLFAGLKHPAGDR